MKVNIFAFIFLARKKYTQFLLRPGFPHNVCQTAVLAKWRIQVPAIFREDEVCLFCNYLYENGIAFNHVPDMLLESDD